MATPDDFTRRVLARLPRRRPPGWIRFVIGGALLVVGLVFAGPSVLAGLGPTAVFAAVGLLVAVALAG
jgi:hypothetical protein